MAKGGGVDGVRHTEVKAQQVRVVKKARRKLNVQMERIISISIEGVK